MTRTCGDFPDAPCCDSCHEDVWYGFDLLEFGDDPFNPHTRVCCGVMHWAEKQGINLDATPENVECPGCGGTGHGPIDHTVEEPTWTCSCGQTFTHGYGAHLCPDNGHREVRRMKPIEVEFTPDHVEEPTCGEPAPYFVWGGMPCSLPRGHAGKHGHPDNVEGPT